MTEFQTEYGLLKAAKVAAGHYEFTFEIDGGAEYERQYGQATIESWHPLFGCDISYFDTMLEDEPDVKVETKSVVITYNMVIGKSTFNLPITIHEKQYEGDAVIAQLRRENKYLRSKVSTHETRLDQLFTLQLINCKKMLDLHPTLRKVDGTINNLSSADHGVSNIFDPSRKFILEHGIDLNKIRSLVTCHALTYDIHVDGVIDMCALEAKIQLLVPSMKKSNLGAPGNSIWFSQTLSSIIRKAFYNKRPDPVKHYDVCSTIVKLCVDCGLNLSDVHDDGQTIINRLDKSIAAGDASYQQVRPIFAKYV